MRTEITFKIQTTVCKEGEQDELENMFNSIVIETCKRANLETVDVETVTLSRFDPLAISKLIWLCSCSYEELSKFIETFNAVETEYRLNNSERPYAQFVMTFGEFSP